MQPQPTTPAQQVQPAPMIVHSILALTASALTLAIVMLGVTETAAAKPKKSAAAYINNLCTECQREAGPAIKRLKSLRANRKVVIGFRMSKAETRQFAAKLGWRGKVTGDRKGKKAKREGVREPTVIVLKKAGRIIRKLDIPDPGVRTKVNFQRQLDLKSLNPDSKPMIIRTYGYDDLTSRNGKRIRSDFREFVRAGNRDDIQAIAVTCLTREDYSYGPALRVGGSIIALADCSGNAMTRDLRVFDRLDSASQTRVLRADGSLAAGPEAASTTLGGTEPWMRLEDSKPRYPAITTTSDFSIPDLDNGAVAIQNFMYYCPTCEADKDHYKFQQWQYENPNVRQIVVTCSPVKEAARWGRSRGWAFPIYAYQGRLSDGRCLDSLMKRFFTDLPRYWNVDTMWMDGEPDHTNCVFKGHPKWSGRSRDCRASG